MVPAGAMTWQDGVCGAGIVGRDAAAHVAASTRRPAASCFLDIIDVEAAARNSHRVCSEGLRDLDHAAHLRFLLIPANRDRSSARLKLA